MPGKTVHLIRHGQSTFNLAVAATPWIDPMLFDAPLSPRGEEQVQALRDTVAALGVELVATSPLTRAVQTALGAFGGGPAPIVVEPMLRECLSGSADVGSPPAVLSSRFPMLGFDHLAPFWWHGDPAAPETVRIEPETLVRARVAGFRAWIEAQTVATIAAVGHGGFFNHVTGLRMNYCEVVTLRA